MNNVNTVVMQGNLTRDPECKSVGDSKLCKFTLASNREYKDIKETCFIEVVTWSGLALIVEKNLTKGRLVLVEGRLKQDNWEKEGQKMSKHSIVATEVIFLDRKESNNDVPQDIQKIRSMTSQESDIDDSLPF